MWAMGIIVFVLVFGALPFPEGAVEKAVKAQHSSDCGARLADGMYKVARGEDFAAFDIHMPGIDWEDRLWDAYPDAKEFVQGCFREPSDRLTLDQALEHVFLQEGLLKGALEGRGW
jgi:hypothetical protein